MDIHGDVLEEAVKDFVLRSGRRPQGILFQDSHAIIVKEFIRLNSMDRKARKTNFSGIDIYASDSFPNSLVALFVIHEKKTYGFIYHATSDGKKGYVKILNPKDGKFPLLRLPVDSVKV